MTNDSGVAGPDRKEEDEALRAYAQLLRQQERTIQILEDLRDELDAAPSRTLLREIRQNSGGDLVEGAQRVLDKLQDTLRAAQVCQSDIHRELVAVPGEDPMDGPDNLPGALARFLVERKGTPGFTYTVRQDAVRGWIIHWKEYTHRGTVRGSGQFYERPYAWLDE
jgi:hypothetical protein